MYIGTEIVCAVNGVLVTGYYMKHDGRDAVKIEGIVEGQPGLQIFGDAIYKDSYYVGELKGTWLMDDVDLGILTERLGSGLQPRFTPVRIREVPPTIALGTER